MVLGLALVLLSQASDAGADTERPRLEHFVRVGTMPGTQSVDDAYWSDDELCVVQGTTKKVRCWNPNTRKWARAVPRTSKSAPAPTGRGVIYDSASGTVQNGSRRWPVASVLGGDWEALLSAEDARCKSAVPTPEEEEAKFCADRDSAACAQWGRYAPAVPQPPVCTEVLQVIRFAPRTDHALLVVRVGELGGYGELVLFVGSR